MGLGSTSGFASRAWVETSPELAGNWDIEQHTTQPEWWPAGVPVRSTGYSTSDISTEPGQHGICELGGLENSLAYPDDTHWLGLPFVIHNFVYFDETATFRNLPVKKFSARYEISLPKTLSYTTPTGVLVQLFGHKSSSMQSESFDQQNSVFCRLYVADGALPAQLPRSPLVKQYHKPLIIHLEGTRPPFQLGSWNMSSGVHELRMSSKQPIGKTIPSLTFIIRQRYNLTTLSGALTIPIEAKQPSPIKGK